MLGLSSYVSDLPHEFVLIVLIEYSRLPLVIDLGHNSRQCVLLDDTGVFLLPLYLV
jgi:hypothetical protein